MIPTRSASLARILAGTPPLLGPFRLVAELGEGGFAPVFVAAEEYGGKELRTVAVKLFAFDDERSPGDPAVARARIVEEARALCHVEHPNVVRFLQIVEAPGGVIGLAMEHVRGRSLGDRIDAEGTLPLAVTLEVGAAVASALAAVHAVGLVHRDVKPGNVIEANGVYKLIDFGIATRARAPTSTTAARASTVAGRPSTSHVSSGSAGAVVVAVERTEYPPLSIGASDATGRTVRASEDPERDDAATDTVAGTMGYIDPACLANGEPANASSDLYALGAMLYECLTGRLPCSEGGGALVLRFRTNIALGLACPVPVGELAPAVPEGLARLVDSLVAPGRERRPQRAAWVACELDRLRRIERDGARALPEEGPFRGLAAFEERHRDVYFGRTAEVASAVELLRFRGVLALVGPSGSGKSSLARAGVLPAIKSGALGEWPPRWTTVALSPGASPRASLLGALASVLETEPAPEDPTELAAKLATMVERSSTGLLILVDALEELVTLADADERAYVAMFLAALAHRPLPGLRAVVTARRDLLDPLLAEPALGVALTRAVQLVSPLTAAAWVDVVDDRLAAYGYALEGDALREELVRELVDAGEAMPLVEFALGRLWEHRDESRRVLSQASLAQIGGLAGALAQHAEATLARVVALHGPHASAIAGELLLALTTPRGTRATRTREELATDVPDPLGVVILAAFESERLVVVEGAAVKLAHDALIVKWPRLHDWVQSMRREREAAHDVEEAAARWRARPERDLLLRGGLLSEARQLSRGTRGTLSRGAQAFVSASRWSELRATLAIVTLASVVLVGLGTLGALYVHDTKAAERRADAEKREALRIYRVLAEARDRPAVERTRTMEELVTARHQCERSLARCMGDAGAITSE